LAAAMRTLGHKDYKDKSPIIPRLIHQLRRDKQIPIDYLPSQQPDGSIGKGYVLKKGFKIAREYRVGWFLTEVVNFPGEEEAGREEEKDVDKLRSYFNTCQIPPELIESDLDSTLDQGYLEAFPKGSAAMRVRAATRLSNERRYIKLLADNYIPSKTASQ